MESFIKKVHQALADKEMILPFDMLGEHVNNHTIYQSSADNKFL